MNSVRLRQVMLVAMVAAVALASSSVVFAQEAAGAGGNDRSVLHLFGAALGLGMIVIGAALGILMVQRKITETQAFTLLTDLSQSRHRKLRDLADAVVESGELPA